MKRAHTLMLSLSLAASAGCIRWEEAEASWCNDAYLEHRHDICGMPDTSVAGPAPTIQSSQSFGGDGRDTVQALASLPSGMWFGGSFDAPMKLGTSSLVSSGAADAYLARMDTGGRFVSAVSFGGFGADQVVDLQAGPADSLYVAAQFQTQTSLPGGGSLSSDGDLDSVLLRLDSNLQPLAQVAFAAEPGSRVEVRDVTHGYGRVVVAGRLVGFMNLGGARVGNGGAAAFVAIFDEELRPLGQIATGSCVDAIGDSVAVGADGEVFFTFRINLDPLGTGSSLLNQELAAGSTVWKDVLVRIDGADTGAPTIPSNWAFVYENSVRNPYQVLVGTNPPTATTKPGYEAPNSVALQGEELIFIRHTPDFSAQRRPGAEVSFLNAGSALPTRGSNTIGRSTTGQGAGQDLHARMQVGANGLVWVFGEFQDDQMLLGNLQNGPFRPARNGFVRVFNQADPTREWARVLVGRSPSVGGGVTGVAEDPSGRVWIAGTFEGELVADQQWVDAKGLDGFLYITEP